MDNSKSQTFAVLGLHNLQLSIPQEEIVGLDVASAAKFDYESDNGTIGRLDCQGNALPLYSLTEELGLADERPQGQNICVSIAVNGVPAFSLTCLSVKPIQIDRDELFPMPGPMADDLGVLQGIVVTKDSIMFTSNALALQNHVSSCGGRSE